jgi:hypothetical protein
LYQHARDRPNNASTVADHHGWQGAPQKQVNLGSVTDPITGEEVPFMPRRSHVGHQHVTPQRLRDLLVTYFTAYQNKTDPKGRLPVRNDRAWELLITEGTCCGHDCQTDADVTRSKGMVLLGGALAAAVPAVPQEVGDTCSQGDAQVSSTAHRCPRDAGGRCLHCTMEDVSARSKLQHLLVRGKLRDLTH